MKKIFPEKNNTHHKQKTPLLLEMGLLNILFINKYNPVVEVVYLNNNHSYMRFLNIL
jgi:hypothetical protein